MKNTMSPYFRVCQIRWTHGANQLDMWVYPFHRIRNFASTCRNENKSRTTAISEIHRRRRNCKRTRIYVFINLLYSYGNRHRTTGPPVSNRALRRAQLAMRLLVQHTYPCTFTCTYGTHLVSRLCHGRRFRYARYFNSFNITRSSPRWPQRLIATTTTTTTKTTGSAYPSPPVVINRPERPERVYYNTRRPDNGGRERLYFLLCILCIYICVIIIST